MILSYFLDSVINFFLNNLYFAIAFAIILLYLLFRKTKVFFTVVLIALLLAVILYMISSISTTGVSYKQNMIHKERADAP